MFSIPTHSIIFNSFFASFFLNNSVSSSCFHLCSFFYTSFSFAILCNFSIMLSTFMLLWILEIRKHIQLLVTNENNFQQLYHLFSSLSFLPIPFIFWPACHLLINTSSSKLWWPITTTFCVPCTTTWKHVTSSLWMNASYFIFQLFCIHNPLKLIILTPCCFPYRPFANYANTSADCVNTSTNCINTSINYVSHNPSLGLTTKAKGLQGSGPRLSSGFTFLCPQECKSVWGKKPSHSQVNSHVGNWSPGGLPNVQRAIAIIKTQWLEKFFIPLERYWNLDV
jgi:hypothetical protein